METIDVNGLSVLVACEQSQVVCSAFRAFGLKAFSNDILPCYGGHPEWHILGDAREVIKGVGRHTLENGEVMQRERPWNMVIAHPPCTCLTHCSAVAKSKGKQTIEQVIAAVDFFMDMYNAPSEYVAVENPAPLGWLDLPPYNQIVQPYDFGHRFSKRVCLWLKNLPPLLPTHARYTNHVQWLDHCSHSKKRRSKTFEGIADAMAVQWGGILLKDYNLFNQ